MKPPFKFSWELVTPAIAREMLNHNPPKQNRNIRPKVVRGFAADMKCGNWSPTHQGIAFAVGGQLIDGQHRLSAVVESGCSIPFMVCREVPIKIGGSGAKVMDAIDRGNVRSIADILKLAHGQAAYSSLVGAICVHIPRIFFHHLEGTVQSDRCAKVTLHQTLHVLELFKPSIKFLIEHISPIAALKPAGISAAIVIAHHQSKAKVEEFYSLLTTGAGLKAESPILALRNLLLNNVTAGSRETRNKMNVSLRVFNAIQAYVSRQKAGLNITSGKQGMRFFLDHQPGNAEQIRKIFPPIKLTETATNGSPVKAEPVRKTTKLAPGESDKDWWKTDRARMIEQQKRSLGSAR